MINPPFFAVSTPQAFHDLLIASGKKEPEAMKAFIQANPEFAAFAAWAKMAPWTASYAEESYHGLNSFIFMDAKGGERAARWSQLPTAQVVPISKAELDKRGPDFLEQEITEPVQAAGPQRWTMVMTVADPGDPTADPSKAWPEGRRTVQVGTLVVQRIAPERDGPCRDINFDPTVLPKGIRVSDDPFLGCAFVSLSQVLRFACGRIQRLSANRDHQAMSHALHRFALFQRLLHWLMAACIVAMLFIGVGMVSTAAPIYLPLILIHKTLGVTLLVLVVIRLALPLHYGAPPLPADLPPAIRLGGRLSHLARYGFMIVMPLLGLGMTWAAAYPVVLYGWI